MDTRSGLFLALVELYINESSKLEGNIELVIAGIAFKSINIIPIAKKV
tara:strand:- start:331 stop:474 length:144 start_codon:yes stop_codon:yes gene_type:complete